MGAQGDDVQDKERDAVNMETGRRDPLLRINQQVSVVDTGAQPDGVHIHVLEGRHGRHPHHERAASRDHGLRMPVPARGEQLLWSHVQPGVPPRGEREGLQGAMPELGLH